MFSERLIAPLVPSTSVFVSAFVSGKMTSQSCSCNEGLSTFWSRADIITYSCVSAFDVMIQVRGSNE